MRQPLRASDQQRHRPAGHHEPAERGKRHRDGEEQQHRLDGTIAGRQPQPVVQPHAAVHPDHQQQRALQQRAVGPQASQFVEIAILDAERNAGDARVDDVGEQQERDQQAEAELGQLPGRQTQRRASRQLVEGETDMGNERRHQQERAGHRARHHEAPALHGMHRIDMDQPERMIEKVRGRKQEQHEPGRDPEPLQRVSAEQNVHGRHLTNPRWSLAPAGLASSVFRNVWPVDPAIGAGMTRKCDQHKSGRSALAVPQVIGWTTNPSHSRWPRCAVSTHPAAMVPYQGTSYVSIAYKMSAAGT